MLYFRERFGGLYAAFGTTQPDDPHRDARNRKQAPIEEVLSNVLNDICQVLLHIAQHFRSLSLTGAEGQRSEELQQPSAMSLRSFFCFEAVRPRGPVQSRYLMEDVSSTGTVEQSQHLHWMVLALSSPPGLIANSLIARGSEE
jgi:hypothetical protein